MIAFEVNKINHLANYITISTYMPLMSSHNNKNNNFDTLKFMTYRPSFEHYQLLLIISNGLSICFDYMRNNTSPYSKI